MTAIAHEGQRENRWREAALKEKEDTCHKTEDVCWRKRNAHDTALKSKIKVKLDPEAGLHLA